VKKENISMKLKELKKRGTRFIPGRERWNGKEGS
jgi:hypothetical protein